MIEDKEIYEPNMDMSLTYPSPEQLLITAETIFEQKRFQQILRNPTIKAGALFELLDLKEMKPMAKKQTIEHDDTPINYHPHSADDVPHGTYDLMLQELINPLSEVEVFGYNCQESVLQQLAMSFAYRALGAKARIFQAAKKQHEQLAELAEDLGIEIEELDHNDPDVLEILETSKVAAVENEYEEVAPKAAYFIQSLPPNSINLMEISRAVASREPNETAVRAFQQRMGGKVSLEGTKRFMMQNVRITKEDEQSIKPEMRKAREQLRTMPVEMLNLTLDEFKLILDKLHKRSLTWLGDKSITLPDEDDKNYLQKLNAYNGQLMRDSKYQRDEVLHQTVKSILDEWQNKICEYIVKVENDKDGTDTPPMVINDSGEEPVEMH